MAIFLKYVILTAFIGLIQAATLITPEEISTAELIKATRIEEPHDAFISYRRTPSRYLAMLIKVMLKSRANLNGFIDVENLQGGDWNQQLLTKIKNTPNFIIILSNGTLDRCKGDTEFKDTLHQEIRDAVESNRRIIPVFDEYPFPSLDGHSDVVKKLFTFQGVEWEHALAEASFKNIVKYMEPLAPPPPVTFRQLTSLEKRALA